jgi:2-methylcitrate dehydratase PrpD
MNKQQSATAFTPSLTGQLVEAINARGIDARDLEAAALFTLDAVANLVAGRNSGPGRKLLAWQRSMEQLAGSEAIDRARLSFLYGALCHILEVDDLHRASVVHPGCVVVPAVLAMAAGHDGRAALTAVLKGFEACCRVGMSVGQAHYRIWHNTATCGPFGSAMAVADLLNLDETQTIHALGNAGSQSAGLWEFLDTGAETKHLHAGRGAEAGVVAATLAAQGFTGAATILEGKRGFFKATCPDPDPSQLVPMPDESWQVHQTSIKPWPSCRHTHPAIDCALTLYQRAGGARNIRSVRVECYQAALDLCDRTTVTSPYDGKFSLQHCVAAALADGEVIFDSFEAEARTRLADLRSRISVTTADTFASAYPVHWGSRVVLAMSDGSELAQEVADARGDPELPLSAGELAEKARGLLDHGGLKNPDLLIDEVLSMADGGPVPDLSGLVRKSIS